MRDYRKDRIEIFTVANGRTAFHQNFYRKTKRSKKLSHEEVSESCVCKSYCQHINIRFKFSKFAVGY